MTVFVLAYMSFPLMSVKNWDIETIYHEGREYHWSDGNVRFENWSGVPLESSLLNRCCKFNHLGPVLHTHQ